VTKSDHSLTERAEAFLAILSEDCSLLLVVNGIVGEEDEEIIFSFAI
jgi:hypothetical protein